MIASAPFNEKQRVLAARTDAVNALEAADKRLALVSSRIDVLGAIQRNALFTAMAVDRFPRRDWDGWKTLNDAEIFSRVEAQAVCDGEAQVSFSTLLRIKEVLYP